MAAKPASEPRWANVGGVIVVPPSGKQDVGHLDGEQPPASHLNWLFNLVYQWIRYVSDQAFTGAVSATGAISALSLAATNAVTAASAAITGAVTSASATITGLVSGGQVQTAEPDIRHADATNTIPANEYVLQSGGFTQTASGSANYKELAASTAGVVVAGVRCKVGDRIKSISVYCKDFGGVVGNVQIELFKALATAGTANVVNSNLNPGGTAVASAATTNVQKLTVTPSSPETVVADAAYHIKISGINSAGAKYVFHSQVVLDKIAA